MVASSEIEKLERRYAENPDGRYFAPLADAYRKAGQVDRALEVVRAGLEKHPDYLSAHIVLGRCLLDKKQDDEAGQAFERVLLLDGENIIALKSLSEVAERRGEPDRARQWLQTLLRFDPMNAEAEAELQRLGGPLVDAATAQTEALPGEPALAEPSPFSFADVTPEEPAASALPEVARPEALELQPSPGEAPGQTESVTPGVVSVQFQPPTEAVPPAAVDLTPFDESLAWGTGERSSRSVSQQDLDGALELHDESVVDRSRLLEVAQEPGAVGAEGEGPAPVTEPLEAALPSPAPPRAPAERGGVGTTAPSERSAPYAAAADFGAFELVGDAPKGSDTVQPGALEAPSSPPPLPEVEPLPDSPAGLEAPPAEPETPPMVTETMGDLYLKQGFRTEAADVYRSVLVQRPGDAGLRAKLAALEAPPALSAQALGGESVRVWLRRVAAARVSAPPAAADTLQPSSGLSPLEEAFAQPESPAEPAGEPTHPAADAFTLDSIFGGPTGASPAPQPGAAPAAAPAPPSGSSFDEFFGAPAEQASVRPDAATPPAPPPAEDDISSFNTWLRGLKR